MVQYANLSIFLKQFIMPLIGLFRFYLTMNHKTVYAFEKKIY